MTRARDLANIADGTFTATDLDLSGTLTVSGDANFDSGSLFVDVSANAVGIGTSSPAGALHVYNGSAGEQYISSNNSAMRFVSTGGANYIQSGTATSSSSAADLIFTNVGGSGETMRIDSSGNLLVGKTSADDGATAGTEIQSDAQIYITKTGGNTLFLNRLSTDGDIARFFKDGTQVGSLSIEPAGFCIDGEASHSGIRFQSSALLPRYNGAAADNVVDLATSANRFKDLYLSGGVYLGGTGAANLLDDYETGTFTPTLIGSTTAGTPTYTARAGNYTKIGDLVYFNLNIIITAWSGSPAGEVRVTGLPFNSEAGFASRGYSPVSTRVSNYSGYTMTADAYIQPSSDYVRFDDLPDASADSAFEIRLAGTYKAA